MTDDLTAAERTCIEDAIRAVGPRDPARDQQFDPKVHAELVMDATALRDVLANNQEVAKLGHEFKTYDKRAGDGRRRLEFFTELFGLAVIAAIFAAFVIVFLPLQTPVALKGALAIAIGLALTQFVWSCIKVIDWKWPKAVKGKGRTVANQFVKSALFCALTFVAYVYLADRLFTLVEANPAQEMGMLMMAFAAAVIPLGIFYWLGFQERDAWHKNRSEAEWRRRDIFLKVLSEMPANNAPATCQALEYYRRFLIEDQLAYFTGKAARNRLGHASAIRQRNFAQNTLVLAIILTVVLWGLDHVQVGSTGVTDQLAWSSVWLSVNGWDAAMMVGVLAMVGTYLFYQLNTSMFAERETASRCVHTGADLRVHTSPQPFAANLGLDVPLTRARIAAAKGDIGAVRQFLVDVNFILATEVAQWGLPMPYSLKKKAGQPHVVSTEILRADVDFEELASELAALGVPMIQAIKVAKVAARQVPAGTEPGSFTTHYNGAESIAPFKAGDWKVTNMNAADEVIIDGQGHNNVYVIEAERFAQIYEPTGESTEHGDVYRASGERPIDALYLGGGFDIKAPWGERQIASGGYIVRKFGDVYGIHEGAFDETYQRVTD